MLLFEYYLLGDPTYSAHSNIELSLDIGGVKNKTTTSSVSYLDRERVLKHSERYKN